MNLSQSDTSDREGPFPAGPITPGTFSPEELGLEEAFMQSLVSASFPNLDVSPGGSFYEGFIRPGAVVLAAVRKTAIRFRKSQTLNGVSDSSFEDLDSDATASLLSNFLLTVDSGDSAMGQISIQVSTNRLSSIPRGTVFFTDDGITFVTPSEVNAGPGVMESDGSGTWTFRVPVIAEVPGEAGNIPRSEELSTVFNVPSLIRIYASAAFSGGRSGAKSSEIKEMVMSSISTRGMTSPASILATVRDTVPSVDRVAVVGPFHPLMSRNRHGAGGIPLGGFEDVYVRTSRTIETKSIDGIAIHQGEGVYLASINSGAYPGHYAVVSVKPADSLSSGSFEISNFTRGIDPAWPGLSSSYPLRVANQSFVALSKWQTSSVEFSIPVGSVYGAEFPVKLEVWGIPAISDVQAVISDPSRAQSGLDRIVKAAVPCVVSLSRISVGLLPGADRSVAKTGIDAAFSFEVSQADPGEGVRAEKLVSAFMAVPGVSKLDLPLSMIGVVLTPSGEQRASTSKSVIRISTETDFGYGPDNTEFFPDPLGVPIEFLQ